MALVNKASLKQYLDLNYNVLLIGAHGIGKTALIKELAESAGLKWKYFSASTLDPWVDFVGIPKVITENGQEQLKLIQPSFLDDVEFIFLDEFNRAPDKVINAVMELIQFKTINGRPINNLKVIWAAINPEDDDDTYSVNHLDPAQLDRFHVHLHLPFKIDEEYFMKKYPTIGKLFVDWWKEIPEDLRKLVSPRRLDYAAHAFMNSCRLEDFLPVETNVAKLRTLLKSLPFHEQIKQIKTDAEAVTFITDVNNATKLLDMVRASDAVSIDFFTKYKTALPQELIEPFAELVYAKKQGFEVVGSIQELVERLSNDKGNQGTAALINNVNLDLLYKNGGSLENDLRALAATHRQLMSKLATRCMDVLVGCRAPTIERIFWGVEGKESKKMTNFHKIVLIISKIGGFFTVRQCQHVNGKLYNNKIVSDMHYL